MNRNKRKRQQRPQVVRSRGFVVHSLDDDTVFDEILTDDETHEAGRDRAKAKLAEMLTTHPQTNVGYTEYDENGNVIG